MRYRGKRPQDIAEDLASLSEWQDEVDRWGGRTGLGASQPKQRMQELQTSKLGGRAGIPWFSNPGTFDRQVVTLCEMKLSAPLDVDLVIGVPNNAPPYENINAGIPETAPNFQPDPNLTIDNAKSFIRITWGSQQGSQFVAEADVAQGWRYPFRASYLRADWILPNRVAVLEETYVRDFLVIGQIVPTVGGGTVKPLCRSVYFTPEFGSMPPGAQTRVVPPFSRWAYVHAQSALNSTPVWTLKWLTALGDLVGEVRMVNNANTTPVYSAKMLGTSVPSMAQKVEFTNGSGVVMDEPSMLFELSI